ncbi:MAG: hypothetical protein DSZ12_06020 [Sulfurovum sp.]|nr:MAG: hypothetical protein DSZ08_03555 [Sulfurovum sp.]RUM74153.1 MAG: hypothetical protein DSZ12_06020 [Sulfurovum sp.]
MKTKTIKLGIATATALMMNTSLLAGGDIAPMVPMVDTKAPASATGWKSKHKFFGFSQIGLKFGDGAKLGDNADVGFEADRVRLGWKYFSGPLAGKVFLDFAKKGSDNGSVGVPDMVKDAFISYKFDDAMVIKTGVIKTPVGMGFTIPGWNLDVIKRGFDKKLAFERAFGMMISGRDIGFGNNGKVNGLEMGHERPWKGFGYDIMVTGATGRSGAVNSKDENGKVFKPNQENGYMGRLMFDWGQALHTEVGYGKIKGNTDGSGEDYKVLNAGIDSHFNGANVKVEYYDVQNIRGKAGWDMNTLALTGTYYLTDTLEFAVKDIRGTETRGGKDADAANTYIGLNYYINPKNNKMDRKSRRGRNRHRIQINYVLADVDKAFKGVGALYRDDTVLMQYQFKF